MVRSGLLRLQGEAPQGVRLREDPADGPSLGAVEGAVGVVGLDHAALVDALQDDEVSDGREVPCRDAADDGLAGIEGGYDARAVRRHGARSYAEHGRPVGHEAPLGRARGREIVLVCKGSHARRIEIGLPREVDIHHGEACWTACRGSDVIAGIGSARPCGIGLIQVRHRPGLPCGAGRRDGHHGGAEFGGADPLLGEPLLFLLRLDARRLLGLAALNGGVDAQASGADDGQDEDECDAAGTEEQGSPGRVGEDAAGSAAMPAMRAARVPAAVSSASHVVPRAGRGVRIAAVQGALTQGGTRRPVVRLSLIHI